MLQIRIQHADDELRRIGIPVSRRYLAAAGEIARKPRRIERQKRADRDRHGYAVMQDVRERTDGALSLSPSSLYAAIRRLLTQGLIEELTERPDPEHDDERRRYYRLTRLGRAVAAHRARERAQRERRQSAGRAPRGRRGTLRGRSR